jgi:hypothetical protein
MPMLLFAEALEALKVHPVAIGILWAGVRAGGWIPPAVSGG